MQEILLKNLLLLNHNRFLENTVIIYTSDHGELCGEHGLWWKNTWHEASTRVPLIVSLSEHRNRELPPIEIVDPVSLADIFPTLCGLAEITTPESLDGVDLSGLLRGGTNSDLAQRAGVITESLSPRWGVGTEFRMIRSKWYKYIAFRGCEDLAFDLQNDPNEQHNLLSETKTADELVSLKAAVLENFDFDQVEQIRQQDMTLLQERYPMRITPKTPNQILLGDGRLVEADTPLYTPNVVSKNPSLDFDDYP